MTLQRPALVYRLNIISVLNLIVLVVNMLTESLIKNS